MSEGQYVTTAETHVGVVIFLGERAYKFKKPVDMGVLDFTQQDSRWWACHREYELNRQFAPDVYLGVSAFQQPDLDGSEPVLVMRRLPPERSLASLVESGVHHSEVTGQIAELLAESHANAPRSSHIDSQGRPDAVRARWHAILDRIRPFGGELLDTGALDEIERRALAFVDRQRALFDERIKQGRIVDGHGDLLAQDIFCLDDGPRVLDCIEFDDELRYLDGLDDAACLAMDLEYLGARRLSARFLDQYRQRTDDHAPASLAHHYVAYRALMRARVACVRYQPGADEAANNARRHLELAVSHLRAGTPRTVLVGGLPGTGKSTVASWLAEELGAESLASDTIRAELADAAAPANQQYQAGRYRTDHTDRIYHELVRRGEYWLAHGQSVVLDASWVRDRHRQLVRQAVTNMAGELVELQCAAPQHTAERRLRERGPTASDADPAVARAMAADATPWPQATTIDTSGTLADSLEQARIALRVGHEHSDG